MGVGETIICGTTEGRRLTMEEGGWKMEEGGWSYGTTDLRKTKMARDFIPRHLIYCLLFLAAKVVSKCARSACIPMFCATHLCIELTFKGVFDAH